MDKPKGSEVVNLLLRCFNRCLPERQASAAWPSDWQPTYFKHAGIFELIYGKSSSQHKRITLPQVTEVLIF